MFFRKLTLYILAMAAACAAPGCDHTYSDLYNALVHGRERVPTSGIHLTGVTAMENSISIAWCEPEEDDFDHASITCSDGAGPAVVLKGVEAYTRGGLVQGTEYTFVMRAVDRADNISESVEFTVKTTESGTVRYHYIYTAEDLNAVRGGVAGYDNWQLEDIYTVMADIDLSGYTADGGWLPLGTSGDPFTGTMKGNGHTVRNFFVNRSEDYQGLFGYTGSSARIMDLALENAVVTGGSYTGGLAGRSGGSISGCTVSGAVAAAGNGDVINVGGLVGLNNAGSITNSSFAGTVTSTSLENYVRHTGGLVGQNSDGAITGCTVSGSVTATGDAEVYYTGGLVGSNLNGNITGCSVSDDVESDGNVFTWYTGGLVGYNLNGNITGSCATGDVAGTGNSVGGLVGDNYRTNAEAGVAKGEISRCFATGDVTGNKSVGGLVGTNRNGVQPAKIINSCATGAVKGTADDDAIAGGLVGSNTNTALIQFCYAAGPVTGEDPAGGLVGSNTGNPIANSYYYQTPINGEGVHVSESAMRQQATYTEWDFESIWAIDEGASFPFLQD